MTCHQRTKLVNSNIDFSDELFSIHSKVLQNQSCKKAQRLRRRLASTPELGLEI